jgi:thioredoxin 1
MDFKISTKNEFTNNLIKNNNKINIVMFSASWCGPCKTIRPEYIKMQENDNKHNYLYIDIDEYDDENDDCEYIKQVESVPTFMIFIGTDFVSELSFNELNDAIKDCEKMKYQIKINEVVQRLMGQGLNDDEIKKVLINMVNNK